MEHVADVLGHNVTRMAALVYRHDAPGLHRLLRARAARRGHLHLPCLGPSVRVDDRLVLARWWARGGFGVELSPGEQEVSLSLWSEVEFSGRVVDVAGSPIAGARVLAVPTRDPVPPKPDEATTGADGTFRLGGLPFSYCKLLVIGPDGTWTLAGMVNGDPATATEFFASSPTHGDPIPVGDITLAGP